MIKGIWATDAHTLDPEQWVNVWLVNHWNESEYYTTCQVKELEAIIADSHSGIPDDFGLELIEDTG